MYRRLPRFAVPGFGPICLDTNDPETVFDAFRKRLLRDIPKSDVRLLAEFKKFVAGWVEENIKKIVPYEFEEWLATTSYNEARKGELREAWRTLRGGLPDEHACASIDSFIKSEFYDVFKFARVINSRSDLFKVFSGPIFKAIEDEVYKHPAFIKHVPVPDRPVLVDGLRLAGCNFIDSDFEAFESHFVKQVMEACECALYTWCVGWWLCESHVRTLVGTIAGMNKMKMRNGTRGWVVARRMSGDMCTSLGNGFTNLMLALFIAHRHGYSISGFVEGDDGIFALSGVPEGWLEGDDCPLVQAYRALGFSIKIHCYDDPCQASFCGMIFGRSGQIVRDPRHFVRGFAWTQSFISAGDKIMFELLRAKALSAAYETPHCPIVGIFARAAIEATRGYDARFVNDGFHTRPPSEWTVPEFAPTLETRMLFADKFGISPEDQVRAEAMVLSDGMGGISELLGPSAADLFYTTRFVEID